MSDKPTRHTRRSVAGLLAGAGLSGLPLTQAFGQATAPIDANDPALQPQSPAIRRRVSGFQARRWRDHFDSLSNGAILVDTNARALHFWDATDSLYKIYPTSVPLTEDLTRRGRTRIVQKRVGPDWRPTPNMLRRDPTLPDYVGPGPRNPLGTHALYLSWTYYRIHGTNDVRKIGRRSSNGCIGLYNEQIEELFGLTSVGTQVVLI